MSEAAKGKQQSAGPDPFLSDPESREPQGVHVTPARGSATALPLPKPPHLKEKLLGTWPKAPLWAARALVKTAPQSVGVLRSLSRTILAGLIRATPARMQGTGTAESGI